MKAYIYPITARLHTGLHNPYLDNFVSSLGSYIEFLNYKAPSSVGIIDLWKYLFQVDIIFLNWIENLPDKKAGKLQWYIFLLFMVPIIKMRGVKVCWTLHNKLSHEQQNLKSKEEIFNKLFCISDFIITHAGEGAKLVKNRTSNEKLIFFHHPLNEGLRGAGAGNQNIDIFIWGTIAPYKGIDIFLDQVDNSPILKNLNIVIAGKITNGAYKKLIEEKLGANIKLRDKFLSNKELEDSLKNSKITLFTYNKNSVLSSGALSDSIGFGNIVVGPDTGAFKDLKDENIIYTYKDTSQIPDLCEKLLSDISKYKIDESLISSYISKYSWQNFAQMIIGRITS